MGGRVNRPSKDEELTSLREELAAAHAHVAELQNVIRKHDSFTENVRKNQEKVIMRISGFLANELHLVDVSGDFAPRSNGKLRDYDIGERLHSMIATYQAMRAEKDRWYQRMRDVEEDRDRLIRVNNDMSRELMNARDLLFRFYVRMFTRVQYEEDTLKQLMTELHSFIQDDETLREEVIRLLEEDAGCSTPRKSKS